MLFFKGTNMRRVVQLLVFISLVLPIASAHADGESQSQMVIINEDGQQTVLDRTHSLVSPYLDSDLQSRWWEFGGDTIIDTNRHVRLTYDRASQAGWIFSRLPLTATNFEILFEFKIHGKGSGVFGDGMALWITKERAQTGTVFGFTDNFEGLGIFIDTYKNSRTGITFPYVMAMIGDGKTAYDAANDGKANDVGGCSARGLRKASIPTRGRLKYRKDSFLSFELQYKKEGEWQQCFTIPNFTLPTVAYLGFSAHTGEVSDNHDIISVETRTIFVDSNTADTQKKIEKHLPGLIKPKGRSKPNKPLPKGNSFGMEVLRVIGALLIMGLLYFAWTVYRVQRGERY